MSKESSMPQGNAMDNMKSGDDGSMAGMTKQDKEDMIKMKKWYEEHKDDLANGPIKNRTITDWFCCCFFVLFCIGMVGAFVYGQMFGDPSLITIGWDGNEPQMGCGYTPNTELWPNSTMDGYAEYPYLYFVKGPTADQFKTITAAEPDPIAIKKTIVDLLSQGVCVKECPKMDTEVIECMQTTKTIADESCNGCQCQMFEQTGDGETVDIPFRYDTVATPPIGNGFCVPTLSADTNESVRQVIEKMKEQFETGDAGETVTGAFKDITDSWQILVISSITAVILGYIFLFVIQALGGYIVWIAFALIVVALAGGGLYTWYQRDVKYRVEDNMYMYMTWGAYGLWGLCGLVLILLCCFRHAIKVGIAVFKCTSMYVKQNLKIFILPAVSYVVIGLWSIFWLVGALWVFSAGYPEPRDDGFPFLTIMRWDDKTHGVFFYDVFGLFWINAFIIGVCQFIIGASACIWYFEVSGDTKGEGTLGVAFKWAFKYHLGSVAFGSFIIAVCQMMRFLFEYYRKKIGAAEKTKLVKVLLCVTGYLLWLMEKCVKFISKNAYIQVALQNTHFFKSAWNAFALVIKNAHRFGAAASIGNIFMVSGMLMIMCVNGLLGYLFLTQFTLVTVQSPIPPVAAICVISGLIGYTFISIFSFTSDAILQSFLLDEELRFSGQNRPEYIAEFAEELKKRGTGCCGGCCGC